MKPREGTQRPMTEDRKRPLSGRVAKLAGLVR
jgi:hypothetical protein